MAAHGSILACGFVTLLVLAFVFTTFPALQRQRRWTYHTQHWWLTEGDHEPDPIYSNSWYQYVSNVVKSVNRSNCYVCSYMPKSAKQVTIYGMHMNKSQAKCYASMAGIGYQHYYIKIDDTDPYSRGLKNGTCDKTFWVNWKFTTKHRFKPQRVVMKYSGYDHPMCYKQSIGTESYGITKNCKQTAVQGEGAPVALGQASNGTYWVQGGWWLCGRKAYPVLSPGWTGVCAPIFVSDHTFIIDKEMQQPSRQKRQVPDVKTHDRIWGADVPEDFKLWTTGQKIALSLFPWEGVAKLMLRMETLDYRLGLYVNTSYDIVKLQNTEIDSLRELLMMHQMALDLLTAADGGICVKFNLTCCTYVPDNVHNNNMTNALTALCNIQKAMSAAYVTGQGWLQWFFSGAWWQVFLRSLIPLGVILICMSFFCCCIIPCIRSMISRALSQHAFMFQQTLLAISTEGQYGQYTPLPQETDDDHNPKPEDNDDCTPVYIWK